MNRRCLALPALALLAACASAQSQYPSLAIRPGERTAGTLQPAPAEPAPPPVTAPATLDKLAQLTTEADAAHKAFIDEAASVRPVLEAAHGAAVGDDAWSSGEAALADLRAARGKTMIPLADLDLIYDDASTAGRPVDQIAAARDHVESLVSAEDATVSDLAANLQ